MAVENRYPLQANIPFESKTFQRPVRSLNHKSRLFRNTWGLRHLIILFFATILFFLAVAEIYYYVITCDQLKIKKVEVTSSSLEVQHQVQNYLQTRNLGNILICDLSYLRANLLALPGVKEIRLEKVLPSTLKVEVFPRTPRLYIRRGNYFLVDDEGKILGSLSGIPDLSFPVLEDEGNFEHSYEQKIRLTCQILDSLEPRIRASVHKITFRSNGMMELQLIDDPVKIFLEAPGFSEKLKYYLENRETWAQLFGPLEYVDLRIEDRAYIKPLSLSANNPAVQGKEAS
ncbi:MAG: FtsQ-type POTRA domain-containing protein [Acidobacteriota bacterium]|nr:FtsQ-type POTRA domain-containing protein [Acidobacteriota bacterium]MDW3228856.1 FtsQ-type POTRA domain-containing protein [Acidobacteriota bacterium]